MSQGSQQLVTLQSNWSNGQSQAYQGTGVFTFTYDDATPATTVGGTTQHPNATYRNAITSARFAFNNLTLDLDTGADNTVSIYVLDGFGTNASITLSLLDSNKIPYSLTMRFEDHTRQFADYALSNLNGLFCTENATFLYPATQLNPGRHALYQQTPLVTV